MTVCHPHLGLVPWFSRCERSTLPGKPPVHLDLGLPAWACTCGSAAMVCLRFGGVRISETLDETLPLTTRGLDSGSSRLLLTELSSRAFPLSSEAASSSTVSQVGCVWKQGRALRGRSLAPEALGHAVPAPHIAGLMSFI